MCAVRAVPVRTRKEVMNVSVLKVSVSKPPTAAKASYQQISVFVKVYKILFIFSCLLTFIGWQLHQKIALWTIQESQETLSLKRIGKIDKLEILTQNSKAIRIMN